jgi:hypothetical protein
MVVAPRSRRTVDGAMGDLVMFVCIAPSHVTVKLERSKQNLTIHDGKWAVCPAGLADGHLWKETPGLRYDDLFVKWAAEHPTTV